MRAAALALRRAPENIQGAFREAKQQMRAHRAPLVVEILRGRVANVAIGAEIDAGIEFEASPRPTRRPRSLSSNEEAGALSNFAANLKLQAGEAFQLDGSQEWALLADERVGLRVAHVKLADSRPFRPNANRS